MKWSRILRSGTLDTGGNCKVGTSCRVVNARNGVVESK